MFLSEPLAEMEVTREQYGQRQVFRRTLARKIDKDPEEKKIQHEKLILEQIRNHACANVCRFYESSQPEYRDNLFMVYCEYSDFSVFKRARKTVMSLLMRLYFLSQVAEGLRFLHRRGICHLDLKPQNLLIGKGFVLKLSDFGEAYHPSVCAVGREPVTQSTGRGTRRPTPRPRAVRARSPFRRSSTRTASE